MPSLQKDALDLLDALQQLPLIKTFGQMTKKDGRKSANSKVGDWYANIYHGMKRKLDEEPAEKAGEGSEKQKVAGFGSTKMGKTTNSSELLR